MCGLVGVIAAWNNGFTTEEADVLEELLYMDALRGEDATGIMYADRHNNIQVHKAAIPSYEFLATDEWKGSKKELIHSGRWAFGHNRAATRGAKVDKNAHPFVIDDKIVLMQNGTYRGCHKHHKDVEVDTEAVAHTIAETENIEEALQSINAAYAFIWYDVRTKQLHLIRNTERPLWVAQAENGAIFFCSEPGILMASLYRHTIKLKKEPYQLPAGELLTFDWSGAKYTITETALDCTFRPKKVAHQEQRAGGLVYRHEFWDSTRATPPGHSAVHSRLTILEAMEFLGDDVKQVGDITQVEAVRNIITKDKAEQVTHLLEGVDYTKVYPRDKNDNTYYVFGAIVGDKTVDPLAGIVVVWTIDTTEEGKIMDYVTNHMFSADIDYVVQKPLSGGRKEFYFAAVAGDVKIACNLPTLTEVTHAH